MKTNKILLGGLAGGVTFFLLGFIFYGTLLSGYMAANLNQCASKPMTDMVWWAMILANLSLGYLLTLIFSWSKISGIAGSAKVSAIIGALISLSTDLGTYSLSNMYKNFSVILVDVTVYTAMLTITGVVISVVIGSKKG